MVALGLSLGAAAAAQVRQDQPVRLTTARFWRGEGKTLVEALIGVPVRGTDGAGVVQVDFSVRDASGKMLFNEAWTDTIDARLLAAARTRVGIETNTPMSFAVQPGDYTVQAVVTRAGKADTVRTVLRGFAAQPVISDVLVGTRIRSLGENEQPTSAETRKGRYAIERGTRVTVLPTDPKLAYYVELYPLGATAADAQLEFTIVPASGGNALFRTQRPLKIGERGGIDVAAIPVAGLPPGEYTLQVTARAAGKSELHEVQFNMGSLQDAPAAPAAGGGSEAELAERYFSAEKMTDTQAGELIEALTLATPGESVPGSTTALPIEARRRFLARYWSRLPDPRPETPAHEMLEEYVQRVAFVNREYVEKDIGRSGPRTDRGRIYLRYGPPDTKHAQPMAGNRSVEIWKYTRNKSLKYAFIDETGFSNYKLVYTTDPQEPSLADWQDRVRDADAIRLILSF